ncbi:MAG: hypothetical protein ACLS28_21275 [Clostridium neonatale]
MEKFKLSKRFQKLKLQMILMDAKYAKTVNTYFITGDDAGDDKAKELYDKYLQ